MPRRLPNPKLAVFPIGEVAAIGRELGVPLIMDNTAAPVICRPFEHGAAIVVYSTTKYVGGHGTSIGGMIIDGGNFDWEANAARFPMLTKPDASYHGAIWTEAAKPLGPVAYILKARTTLQRDLGMSMSPFNAFQFIQGLETLPLRMREHCRNGAAIADYLKRHTSVTRVIYPGMDQPKEIAARAERYLSGGRGGLVGFELKGGVEAGKRFIDALKLVYHVANIGDVRTLGDPSGVDDAFAIVRGRAARHRRHARLCAPVGRHRACRRHHRRSRPGARGERRDDGEGGVGRSRCSENPRLACLRTPHSLARERRTRREPNLPQGVYDALRERAHHDIRAMAGGRHHRGNDGGVHLGPIAL